MVRRAHFVGYVALTVSFLTLVPIAAQSRRLTPQVYRADRAAIVRVAPSAGFGRYGEVRGRTVVGRAAPSLTDDHEEQQRRYDEERRYREGDRQEGDQPRYYAPFFYGAPEGERGDRGNAGDRGNFGDRGLHGNRGHFGDRGARGDQGRFGDQRR